jgi:glucokinase
LAAARSIGVDVGGTKILAGLVDGGGGVGPSVELDTPMESQQTLLDALVGAVQELRTPDVVAVGFGVPARIDRRTGGAIAAVNVPLHEVRLRDDLQERLGLPVTIENDANAAALAEHRIGAGRGTTDLVLLTLGTGVGGGVVSGGRLFEGWSELGHMVIVEDGEPCQGGCTGRGHVESYCSGTAADRLAESVLGPGATARELVAARHPALNEIGHHLGTALGSLVNIFGPELVVIGGGFGTAAYELLIGPAREQMLREALSPGGEDVRLSPAGLGVDAGMIGAGLAALDALG